MSHSFEKSTECMTTGHQNCKKILVRDGDRYRLDSIVHFIYGGRHVEKISR